MRYFPTDTYDFDDVARLAPPDWMMNALRMNPGYCNWGNHEDYMIKDGHGWDSRQSVASSTEFTWGLDDLNEVVNFYFNITRPAHECRPCRGRGLAPEALLFDESFYRRFPVRASEDSGSNYLQCDVDALWEARRLERNIETKPTLEEFKANPAKYLGCMGHDAINRGVIGEARAKEGGYEYICPDCDGHGQILTGEAALQLQLWVIHPRKGCSRGVLIENIPNEAELAKMVSYLKEARDRNANRFAGLDLHSPEMLAQPVVRMIGKSDD